MFKWIEKLSIDIYVLFLFDQKQIDELSWIIMMLYVYINIKWRTCIDTLNI